MSIGVRLKILFYLPVITPWWFDNIVRPLLAALAPAHRVHVLAPVPWCGTGIGPRELSACADLAGIEWHLADDDAHPSMRTDAVERDAIVDFVRALAPDYVLARAADCATVARFPGKVRYLMESGAAPLAIPHRFAILQAQPFDHGLMPLLAPAEAAALDRGIARAWDALAPLAAPSPAARAAFRDWAGLPGDRPVLAVPLEYEHEENFFPLHRVGARPNHRFVAELADAVGDRFFLAFTNHPLNEQHVDNQAVVDAIGARPDRMRLLPRTGPGGESTTLLLARDADAMIVGDSKAYSLAGFFGTPLLRRTRFDTGAWLNAYRDFAPFLADVAAGTARRPSRADARRWFAFHVANQIFDPQAPDFTADELIARLDRPVDPARWPAGFARFEALAGGVA